MVNRSRSDFGNRVFGISKPKILISHSPANSLGDILYQQDVNNYNNNFGCFFQPTTSFIPAMKGYVAKNGKQLS